VFGLIQHATKRAGDLKCLVYLLNLFGVVMLSFMLGLDKSPEFNMFLGFVDLGTKSYSAKLEFATSVLCTNHNFPLGTVNLFQLLLLGMCKCRPSLGIDCLEFGKYLVFLHQALGFALILVKAERILGVEVPSMGLGQFVFGITNKNLPCNVDDAKVVVTWGFMEGQPCTHVKQ
jgi:hypothetical protein